MDAATILKQRDVETIRQLEQYAPVWMTDEELVPEDESVRFTVVFQHNLYGWVQRRYKYDAFADVLYYLGEETISEEAALAFQNETPYIKPVVSDVVNSAGG
jgi:hypothetical protein